MGIQQEDNVKRGAIKYFFIILFQRFMGIGLFFVFAGTLNVLPTLNLEF